MIANILKTVWASAELIELKKNLPQGFTLELYTVYHKCVTDIQFNERMADSFSIQYGDQIDHVSIDKGNMDYIVYYLQKFIDENQPKTAQPENINDLRVEVINNVTKVLNINNDIVPHDDKKMVFELNLYTASERVKILNLLTTVDVHVPEVFIEINLNNSTIEQLTALNDRLIEVEVLS